MFYSKITILYKPPKEEFDYEDYTTWPKIFFTDSYECPEKLDVHLKVCELKKLYHMKDEYISISMVEN